jgi:PAS domain S-box-containing protein
MRAPRVTEQKKVEKRFRESEERFRSIAERSFDAIAAIDSEGRFTYVSPSIERITGYRPEELVGVQFQSFVTQTEMGKVARAFGSMMKGEDIEGLQVEVRRKDGSLVQVEVNGCAIHSDGRVVGMQGIIRDITERKRAEEALREMNEFNRALISEAHEGIIVCDRDLNYRVWNPFMEELTGMPAGKVLGKNALEMFPHLREQGVELLLKRALAGETVTSPDTPFHVPDSGKSGWVSSVNGPQRNAKGEITGVIGLVRDVSERKQSEEALRKQYSTLGGIINSGDAPIFSVDRRYRYTSFNRAHASVMKAIYGKEVEIGRSILDYMTVVEDREEAKRNLDRALAGEHVVEEAYSGEEARSRRYFEVTHNPIVRDGIVIGAAVFVRDFTERKRAEEALKQSEERYRGLVEQSLVGIGISQGNRVIFANPALLKIFGYPSLEEFVKVPLIDHVAPELRGYIEARMKKLAQGEEMPQEFEYNIIRRDGKTRTLQASSTHVRMASETYTETVFEDITERRRAERVLRESEERFSRIFQSTPDPVTITRLEDGVYLEVNKAFTTVTGFAREEAVGRNSLPGQTGIWATVEDRDKFAKMLKEKGEVSGLEVPLRMKNGLTKYATLTARPIEIGGKSCVLTIAHDITERRRMEEELRRSTQFLETIIQSAEVWLDVIDLEGNVLVWNKAAESISGYFQEEVVGHREIWEWLYPDERYRKQIMDSIPNPRLDLETHIRRKDGETRIISWDERRLTDANGKNIGSIAIAQDITDEKRMQNDLKRYSEHLEELVKQRTSSLAESEARYRRLFESSPVSLWEEDFSEVKRYLAELRSKGVGDLRLYLVEHPTEVTRCAGMVKILDVNDATVRLYDAKSVEELRGELHRVFTEDSYDKFREELVALGDGKTQFVSEFDNQTLTGQTKHVSLILSVVPGYEKTLGRVLVSIIDLTERKEMEQRLQQAEHLAAVGETAAMVGHDLRNPLQGIAGATYMLREKSLTAEERVKTLELIDRCVEYSDGIVKDLLDYARPVELARVETVPKAIVESALNAVQIPTRIKVQDQSQDAPLIRVDADKMKRVFVNLVENAVDAMPNRGTLTISSKEVEGAVEFAVSDTGVSLPKDVLENLWKPLQTTKAKGIGMGLAICKRIIDAHGGQISVKSETEEGTTVTMKLPRPNPARQM